MTTLPYQLIDQTGRLASSDRQQIEQALLRCSQQAGTEFDVLVVASVPRRAFREHAVQQRHILALNHGNSVLIVLALEDRHIELATAARYNEMFTPAFSQRLLQKVAVPALRVGRTAAGLVATLEAVADLLTGRAQPAAYGTSRGSLVKCLAVIGLLVGGFGGIAGWNFYRNHTCQGCSGWGSYDVVIVQPATPSSNGTRLHSFHCNRCQTNYHWRTNFSYSDNTSSSGSSSFDSGSSSDGGGGADF